ncbi:MAG: chorismate mutase [Planctomycetes bacterium]|nr:chorismate mutase [Planctomycetota bacterium]MCB9872365.1 chorismate mutase [Planctomycetota bacterium]
MLDRFRDEIDTIDEQVMQLLGRRFAVCREVADFKREQGIPMMQSARVEQVYERARERAVRYGVDPNLAAELYRRIVGAACDLEDRIIDGPDADRS